MISSAHGCIRSTDEDDAPSFLLLYASGAPRFALLDTKREPILPTLSELRESLGSKEAGRGHSYTLEDPSGEVLGFVILRGLNQENGSCEAALMLIDEAAAGEAAMWALDFLLERAFRGMRLRKVMAHVLSRERELCALLERRGFQREGAQREMVYSQGGWLDVVSYAMSNPANRNGEIA